MAILACRSPALLRHVFICRIATSLNNKHLTVLRKTCTTTTDKYNILANQESAQQIFQCHFVLGITRLKTIHAISNKYNQKPKGNTRSQ